MSTTTILAATLGVNFIIVFVGILAYLHNRRSATNLLFFAIALITAIWAFVNYFSIQQTSPQHALLWIRLVLFFAVPHSVAFFLFIHTFPSNRIRLNKNALWVILILSLITMWATISPYVFTDASFEEEQLVPRPGPLMPVFALVILGSLVAGIFLAIRKYLRSDSFERTRWRFMLFGIIVSYLSLIITNFLIVVVWKNNIFNALGALYMLPMIVGSGYAIIQHRLLNIKIIATEILIFLVAFIAFIDIWGYRDAIDLTFRIIIFLSLSVGGILLIRSVLREVEQREKLQELTDRLAVANTELKRLDKAKSEFVSIASHQLRAPLTAIKGYLSLALEGTYGKMSTKLLKPLRNMYDSNERLIHLVNDLLSLSRIESGKMELELEKANIEKIAQSVIDELKLKAEQKNIKLVFRKPADSLPALRLDIAKIRNVILNLIDNAIRYTKKGSITLSIKTPASGIKVKDGSVLISVSDTGEGMTKEELGKLFGSFSRGQAGEKLSTEGAGLGLYIARQFVRMHKGKIWAESPGEGRGSTFFVKLPINREQEGQV